MVRDVFGRLVSSAIRHFKPFCTSEEQDVARIQELILSGYDGNNTKFWIEIYKSDDKGKSFINRTADYIENSITYNRYDHLRVRDIDNNGRLDIFAPDKKDNIRWEWNGSKFIKK